MSPTRLSLGARLATSTALIAGMAIVVFAIVAGAVLWRHESVEEAEGTDEPTAADEVLSQMALALAVTTPIVLGVAALSTRRVARRLTARVDGVIDQATRMSHQALGLRLPLSPADDALDAMAGALNGLFDRLERGLAAQTQFVADASHELRTPLSVLRTELEVARRHPRSVAEWEAMADRAMDDVAHMTEMVEALLRLAQATAVAPAELPVELGALVEDVADRWRAVAARATVSLDVHAASVTLVGDADALGVAIGNLIKNAIAHSPRLGVITVEATLVADRGVEVAVADQGPGVLEAERDRIFMPFARGSQPADRARATEGVGLGLSVARRIVEAHHGTLTVANAVAGGARFVIALPVPNLTGPT